MEFFIPGVEPVQYEDTLAALAAVCTAFMGRDVAPPAPAERVQSITYVSNGEEWTAEVGQTLRGEKTERKQVRGRQTEVTRRLSDPATVWAIFPGDPTLVIHDRAPGTRWENPFIAGPLRASRRFRPPG